MKKLPRIIYVTHPEEDYSNLKWIDSLYEGGVRWIQLRIKENDLHASNPDLHFKATFMDIAELVRKKTTSLGMILSINDEVDVAHFFEADGLHFGLTDKLEESDLKGLEIIGGTANQPGELDHYRLYNLDYVGVGPLRATETKKNTKTALGFEGYKNWVVELKQRPQTLPIYAIGGIQLEDLKALKETGVYGVAVSGLFHKADFNKELIASATKIMEE